MFRKRSEKFEKLLSKGIEKLNSHTVAAKYDNVYKYMIIIANRV